MHGTDGQETATSNRLPPITIGNLAIALLALPLFVALLETFDVSVHPVMSLGVQWGLAIVVLGIAIGGEGLSVNDVGFRQPAWIDLGYIVVTSVAIVLVYSVTDPIVTALGLPVREETAVMGAGAGVGIALARAVTTGVVEEILYRGYPIERLLAFTDSPLVAGGVTWAVFTVAHAASWPLGNLLQTGFVAAILTIVYLRRRTLVPVVGAHVLVWVVSVMGQVYG